MMKATHLTEEQLKEIIYESVITTMNETDAAAYSRAHKATSHNARKNNKDESNVVRQVNQTKSETNDGGIAHKIDLDSQTADSMISPYKNIRYLFYCRNLRQNMGIVLFSLASLYELTNEKAILEGNVVFNNHEMNGRITIDMGTGNVVYYHNSSRRKYPLEIDNRFGAQWNDLVATLQKASKMI